MKTNIETFLVAFTFGARLMSAQSITLTNPTPVSGDSFGIAVAAVGVDRVLMGAHMDNTGAADAGAAYLYSTNGTLLITFTNPTPASGDFFGSAVAGVGNDHVLIGAYSDNTGGTDSGAAYLFSTNGTLLVTFTNPAPASSDVFGYAVAGVGAARVLLGAQQDDTGAANAGATYLYGTNGTLLITITNPAPASGDLFGNAVDTVGTDKLLIGAYADDTNATDSGAAYLFSTNGTLLATFTNPTPASLDYFGYAVAGVGTDQVLIGAYSDNTGGTDSGAAYLFSSDGTLLVTYTNPAPATGDYFGYKVAGVGTDKVLIGAHSDNTGTNYEAGVAYLFSTNGTLLTTYFKSMPAYLDHFGRAVAAVGVNRVVIGAPGVSDTGAAYLFGLDITPVIIVQPRSQTVTVGSNAALSVTISGSMPLGYQWRFNDTDIEGATNASYLRNNTQFADAGSYTVLVTNSSGSATSAVALLLVNPFFNINAGLQGVYDGSVAWGDYDNDGWLDFLLTGLMFGGSPTAQVQRNIGSGFTNINAGLPGVSSGSAAWGDYDNDGRLDILLTGYQSGVGTISQIWRNTGGGFADSYASLPGVSNSSVAWGDYDNDGRLDIVLTGNTGGGSGIISQVRRNTGSDFTDINAGLPGVQNSSVAWGDYDNDGRLDLLLAGLTTGGSHIAQAWRNIGSGFTNINAGLPGVSSGSVAWGDYDNDGWLDILLGGNTSGGGRISQVWRNIGGGFTNINAGLTAVSGSSAAWGDYNNDGRPDIILTGSIGGGGRISQLWRNTGDGFTNDANLPGVDRGSVAWGDYDNDGRLDLLMSGADTNGSPSFIVWKQLQGTTNTVPTAPSGLTTMIFGSSLILNWNASTDGQTPTPGLNYNVRVGSSPGRGDIVGPMADATGFRRLPKTGTLRSTVGAIIPIIHGQTIYCSVQAVDSALAGSPFSAESVVKVLQWEAPPIIVPLNVNSLPIGDYNGNGVLDEGEMIAVLTNYFANSPWLLMTNVVGLGGTNVTFALSNSAAGSFSVEYSTNLADWILLGPAVPQYLFTDTNTVAAPQRYYRLRWP